MKELRFSEVDNSVEEVWRKTSCPRIESQKRKRGKNGKSTRRKTKLVINKIIHSVEKESGGIIQSVDKRK